MVQCCDKNSRNESVLADRSAPYALLEVTKLSTDKSIPYYSDRISVINTGLADLESNCTVKQVKKIVDESLTKITKYAVHWKVRAAEEQIYLKLFVGLQFNH